MYQDHFGLHSDPFALSPSLKFLYRSQAHAETMAHLGYGLEQGEDIIMISGAIGTGKTLALQNLLAKVSQLFDQVLVNVTAIGYVEFLKLVLDEMGETWPDGADAADLLIRMKRIATRVHDEGRKILLVVDEAQNLDTETLEGVRLLTNFGQPDKQLFQIVLAGQPGLEQLVARPALAQLRQRIRVHYCLEPLNERETGEYLNHRTTVAGGMAPLFSAAAMQRIHALSGGIPRLVNHLAGHAMLAAYIERARRVESWHVAAEGLPEAPTPILDATPQDSSHQPVATNSAKEPSPGPTVTEHPVQRQRLRPIWLWIFVLVIAVVSVWYAMIREGESRRFGRRDETLAAVPGAVQEPVDRLESAAGIAQDSGGQTDSGASGGATATNSVTEIQERPVTPAIQQWIHVASFRDEVRARVLQERLAESGLRTVGRTMELDNGEVWERVLVGPYPDAATASIAAAELESRGLISFHRLVED